MNERPHPPSNRPAIAYVVLEQPSEGPTCNSHAICDVGADENTIIENILDGRSRPLRVLATAQSWERDVTKDIACAVVVRAQLTGRRLNDSADEFVRAALGDAG